MRSAVSRAAANAASRLRTAAFRRTTNQAIVSAEHTKMTHIPIKWLRNVCGLKLIGAVRQTNPECRIVVLTGYASISTAVDAIKLGADHYLAKPIEVDAIVRSLTDQQAPDDDDAGDATLSVSRLEWEHIQRVLAENAGNISATARALKMHRRTLQRKLSKRPVRE